MSDLGRFLIVLLLGLICILAVATAAFCQEIKLAVTPKVMACSMWDKPTIRMVTTIERHPDNRSWSLSWSSEVGGSGLSITQLEGEDAPRVTEKFVEVNCGTYTIRACVYRTMGKKFCIDQIVSTHEKDGG